VVLRLNEWVEIVGAFGAWVTEPRVDGPSLRKGPDGTCVFLYRFFDHWLCGLQSMKPRACKLWPFRIYWQPKHGRPKEASYTLGERQLYVYVDPLCVGIQWGTPTPGFVHRTLPEFVEVGLGFQEKQHYSTSQMPYAPRYFRAPGKAPFRRPPPLV